MAFDLYFVNADIANPVGDVAGVGAACKDFESALQERDRLKANPRYVNVRIERRVYGG